MAGIGIGIIGTGSIAITYLRCIEELDETHLVAIYTKSKARVNAVKDSFKSDAYSDIDEFLRHPGIDLVCICNESGNHGEAIVKSAIAGKHVLCEKPIEVTLPKIDKAIDACKNHGVKLGVVFQNRCSQDYVALQNAVEQGKLGKLIMGNAHINWYRSKAYYANNPWRGTHRWDGGAAFINQGIHTIDLLLNIMGTAASVFGKVRTSVHEIEGEDVGVGLITFANGALGAITAGTALYPGYPERLEIFGEKGSVLMEGGKIAQWNVQGAPAPEWMSNEKVASGAADPTNIGHYNHKAVISDMVMAIQQDRSPMVDGSEGRKSVALITALYRSSKTDKQINIEKLD